jgi:FdhD protein
MVGQIMSTLLKQVRLEPVHDRSIFSTHVTRFDGSEAFADQDNLAVEEPLEVQLVYGPAGARKAKSISVTMRTPGHDFELVAGFLMTEGIVKDPADIAEIIYTARDKNFEERSTEEKLILPYQPERNIVSVSLEPQVTVNMANLERNFYTTSSCGICGKASLLALRTVCPPRHANTLSVSAQVICTLPQRLRAAQAVFERTGGLHASGLFNSAGELLSSREDVGRHNAVDKLLGAEFLADRTPLRDRMLLLSGRASFELLQKSVMGGISLVASVGAPSSLAVQVAKEFDTILIGFLRQDHFNVYHGANHILGASTRKAVQ